MFIKFKEEMMKPRKILTKKKRKGKKLLAKKAQKKI